MRACKVGAGREVCGNIRFTRNVKTRRDHNRHTGGCDAPKKGKKNGDDE